MRRRARLNTPDIVARMREEVEGGNLFYALELAQVMGVKLNLDGMDLRGVEFIELDLSGTSFAGANLHMAVFEECNCDSCDFSKAMLHSAELDNCDFRGASFEGADLSGAFALVNDFTGANFRKAKLFMANLGSSNLTGADFRGANLTHTNFQYTNIKDADFTGTDVASAKFSDAFTDPRTRKLNFKDVKFDKKPRNNPAKRRASRVRRNGISPVPDPNRPYFKVAMRELVEMARNGDELAIIELEEYRQRDHKTGRKKFGVAAQISKGVR